jgi:hypothetical protein
MEIEKKDLLKVAHLIEEALTISDKERCLKEARKLLAGILILSEEQLHKDWLLGLHHGDDE